MQDASAGHEPLGSEIFTNDVAERRRDAQICRHILHRWTFRRPDKAQCLITQPGIGISFSRWKLRTYDLASPKEERREVPEMCFSSYLCFNMHLDYCCIMVNAHPQDRKGCKEHAYGTEKNTSPYAET